MKNSIFFRAAAIFAVLFFAGTSFAQQNNAPTFDVRSYVIDVQLSPIENKLTATADVTFVPLADTRTVAFELNGSLKIDKITRINAAQSAPQPTQTPRGRNQPRPAAQAAGPQITFIQDQVGVSDLGPSVRIDLGEAAVKDTPVTLRFTYSGNLNTPSGGPLLTKRLAYVGETQGYLMYAARWFPFHDYAADLATSDITINVPNGLQVVGFSDEAQPAPAGKARFIQSKPGLIGNFAYGRFNNRNLKFGEFDINFYTGVGGSDNVESFGETLGRALDAYTKRFGRAEMGTKLNVVQIDDESLDFYSSIGMLYISDRQFQQPRAITEDRLQREAAYQWWGLTVGLRSFDDAWISQGLAEYSAVSLRESQASGAQLESIRREMVEKALTFEQTSSLLRAPATLDDQSTAYQYIMYGKGALVFQLLKETLGSQRFEELLRTFLTEFRGKNASIDDFEKLTTRVAGQNMRYFFARWVESTGVPEFNADYLIIRTRGGKFIARGTIKQNYDNLRLPVDVQLKFEGEDGYKTVQLQMDEASADFNIESEGMPLDVIIDPGYKLLRISPELRVSSIARRGIEQFKEGNYVEAQAQFEAALKLDRSNSWIYYHLGLLFLEQRNYDMAKDNFRAALAGTLNPPWLQVWSEIKLGNAYDAQGDRTRATAAYGRAQKLGDDYNDAQEVIKKYQDTPYDPRTDGKTN